MTTEKSPCNRIRELRTALGLTQATLAKLAGISRTAVTAIEGDRLIPSVAAAIAIAETLGSTVEELFGRSSHNSSLEHWAWNPSENRHYWRAEVAGRTILYPTASSPILTPLPDSLQEEGGRASGETLVMACCDPAAGFLASQFATATALRLLILPRSSRQAVEMLQQGLVHIAGLHLATAAAPQENEKAAREILSGRFEMVRLARWQEGVALAAATDLRSLRSIRNAKLNWIGRESGSGARQCQDRFLEHRQEPACTTRHHRGITEAIQSGWADAGICLQLVSVEAGLRFLPIQEEYYDVCFPSFMKDDRRIKAFLSVVRSKSYRRLLGELPGYDSSETGDICVSGS
jgi:putative molybdopterin biosynthesis protein